MKFAQLNGAQKQQACELVETSMHESFWWDAVIAQFASARPFGIHISSYVQNTEKPRTKWDVRFSIGDQWCHWAGFIHLEQAEEYPANGGSKFEQLKEMMEELRAISTARDVFNWLHHGERTYIANTTHHFTRNTYGATELVRYAMHTPELQKILEQIARAVSAWLLTNLTEAYNGQFARILLAANFEIDADEEVLSYTTSSNFSARIS